MIDGKICVYVLSSHRYRNVHFGGKDVLSEVEKPGGVLQQADEPDRQWAVVYYALRAGYGMRSNGRVSTEVDDRKRLLAYVRDRQATFGAAFVDQLDAYLSGQEYAP